jgi:hypothetical protein
VAASAFAVESANIVGYQDKPCAAGEFTWTCPTFSAIGGQALSFSLADILPNANFAGFEDTIEFCDEGGNWEGQLTYVSAAWLKGNDLDESLAGWYSVDDEELESNLNNTPVPFARGFCAQTGYDDVAIRFAGEVLQSDASVALTAGEFTWMGNASVANTTLGHILPNANFAGFEDTIEFCDEGGNWEGQLTYVSAAWLKGNDLDESLAGWYSVDDEELESNLNNTPVPFGKAFCAQTGYDDVTITIPTAMPSAN